MGEKYINEILSFQLTFPQCQTTVALSAAKQFDQGRKLCNVKAVPGGSIGHVITVLRHIDRQLPSDISLDGFVADFEAGLWQALKERFPGYGIQGCAFHWSQAVFRKVQEHGLQTAYNQKSAIFNYLRQLMALPFLPAEHIADAFFQLEERAPPEAKPVLDYISNTWIRSTVFTISSWCVFMTPVRTNNDVEGWHNRLNAQVATRGPVPFYFLICELFYEVADMFLHVLHI